MGFGGISIWQLLIILAIIILIFGTKRFRNMGGDLGSAFKNFRKAVKEEPKEEQKADGTELVALNQSAAEDDDKDKDEDKDKQESNKDEGSSKVGDNVDSD